MKNKLFTILSLMLFASSLLAQKDISGTVKDDGGEALIGVNIIEVGTANGTVTDIDGSFTIKVSEGAVLDISYTGYSSKKVTVGPDTSYDLVLREGVALDEIVVTALGISREKKSLTYASQEVGGDELTDVRDANVINSLAGKAAGVFINRSGGGVGGSTRVVLRGNKSLTNNEPLYVVNGIPLTNNRQGQQGSLFGGGIDSGDGISNINPDDIESMTVLKGASAAALYGSQAANGVILITTKKGKNGEAKITFSTGLTTSTAAFIPELQYEYGQTSEGAEFSWGDRVSASNHVDDFFQTGTNWTNSLSISGGSENLQSYFSYSNTDAKGIVPTNELDRHNFTFTQTAKFFDQKLEMNGTVNFINQNVANRPAGGLYFNPLTGLYLFPRGLDFNEYKTNYETFDATRNFNTQNWIADRDIQQNPYWILNRNLSSNVRNRVIPSLTAKVKLTDWMSIQLRGNIDKAIDKFEHKIYASTQGTLSDSNGRYVFTDTDDTQVYADAILSINRNLSDNLSLGLNLGTSHTKREVSRNHLDTQEGNLRYSNLFAIQNVLNAQAALMEQTVDRTKLNAVFASANLGLNNTWYLDATYRTDWSSSLPTQSFGYSSIGLSGVLSEFIESDAIDFLKVRASYATVGNGVDSYIANDRVNNHGYSRQNSLEINRVAPIPGTLLVPELSKSIEFGVDARLFNLFSIDIGYYKTNTINQFLTITAPTGSGFTNYLVNGGDIQNSGIEALLGVKAVDNQDFSWNIDLNFTRNKNEILELHESLADNPFFINDPGVNSYGMAVKKGGSFGDIYGRTFLRDGSGNIVVENGVPQAGGIDFIGNPNPDFMMGLMNTIRFKGMTLKFLIDGRFGGQVMSITEAMLDEAGISQRSADSRNAGGVDVNGTTIDAVAYYSAVGGRNGITENYVYDATNIRLRELSLGFKLPKSVTDNVSFLSTAKVSLVGRNLFFFKNDAPFDPDVTFSTGVGFQGVDIFSLPSTRSLGFNLSLDF